CNVFAEIGFVEDHDWSSATFPSERQVALDAASVEFAVERTDEKHGVDIRSDDLPFCFPACDFARKLAAAHEYKFDLRAFAPLGYQHPIADCWKRFARSNVMAQFSAQFSPGFAVF